MKLLSPGSKVSPFFNHNTFGPVYLVGKEEEPGTFVFLSLSRVKGSALILHQVHIRNNASTRTTLSKGNDPQAVRRACASGLGRLQSKSQAEVATGG